MRYLAFIVLFFLCACGSSEKPAPYTHYGVNGGASSAGVHTVSSGDTLWSIAQRYRIDMKDIIYVNKLSPPYQLDSGQRLTLPPPATYKVRRGDSLYAVSRTFNVNMTQLARQNNLQPPYKIARGQTLRLPSIQPAQVPTPVEYASMATPGVKPDGPATSRAPVARVERKPIALPKTTPARAGTKFVWPVNGRIISSYGPKKDGLHNDGINISAPHHAPVRAAENGIVVYADDQLKGFGNLVLIRHADRWMTAYGHMGSLSIKRGDEVIRGQVIGTVGSTGAVDSPQLHFETRRGTEAINPELYLARQGS